MSDILQYFRLSDLLESARHDHMAATFRGDKKQEKEFRTQCANFHTEMIALRAKITAAEFEKE
ncbi:hypothetical protein [Xanthomonas phage Xp15]|uniref:Uncharacterized protein n=1 Tax=Xanthomonas phage Xp15 TaxID=322855 RepID=Q52PT7_9CAUD|nr:hypothetical protein XPXV15_gp74 [Xanthomonas phage Xp15]AAX84910.1 hypothetical protein [Xanthomonas phage Xp15]